jgi:ferrous iron transport protein A
METRLSTLSQGQVAKILKIDTEEVQIALMKLGILPGDTCKVSNIAPLGDPMAILINRTKVSLRRNDAQSVWVEVQTAP